MFDFSQLARDALDFVKDRVPALRTVVQAVESAPATVKAAREALSSIGGLIGSVRNFADPPTKAELDSLYELTMKELDDTIEMLGDRPQN